MLGANWFQYEYRRTSTEFFQEVFHAHSQMELTYVHEGKGLLIIDGKSYSIEPQTLLVFPPFQMHRIQVHVTSDEPFIRSVLQFEPAVLQGYLNDFPSLKSFFQRLMLQQANVHPVNAMAETEPFAALLKQFGQTMGGMGETEFEENRGVFLLSLVHQLKQSPDGGSAYLKYHNHRVEDIIGWIEKHYAEPFRLEDLASSLHLSPYHVAHLFKESTGTTIVAYTQATRIRHACALLRKTTLPLSEVGYRVGIANPSYFSKIFRQIMGVAPLSYRQHLIK
ncbi:AraC family transcriptional regulator [Paenibacillus glycanilyticus]|uniref:AraC family transcriptional regulator n=1 Tax=Paenibacillus glycanilyticus TaxID=126569 RepID=A0ABQ6G6P7_9BACL|nr:AraC family transcriptional regulator [Paenibacillus glycanilyticus]GLX66222.1 AraC family transcriptional regulator [Paenibacillus glycanilyticus]